MSTLHEYQCTFIKISRGILLVMSRVSGGNCRENENMHFYSVTYPHPPSPRVVPFNEIM